MKIKQLKNDAYVKSKNCSSSDGHMTKHLKVIQNARYVCRSSQLLFAVYVSETI